MEAIYYTTSCYKLCAFLPTLVENAPGANTQGKFRISNRSKDNIENKTATIFTTAPVAWGGQRQWSKIYLA